MEKKDPQALLDLLPGQPKQVPDGHFRDEAGRKDITKVMGWLSFCVLVLLALPYVFKHTAISVMQVPPYVIAPFALLSLATYFKDTATALKFLATLQTAYLPNPAALINTQGGAAAATSEGDATAEAAAQPIATEPKLD